jgi:16S rRNA G527 N7-methylase RsmG
MMDSSPSLVVDGLRRLGELGRWSVGEEGWQVVLGHATTLWLWNRKMNLVGDLSVESAIYRHYGESLFLASFLSSLSEVVDYGSGAGFPGIGVAALFPSVALTLVEARQKRAAFLREAFRGAGGVRVWCGEGERFPGQARVVVTRAVNITEVVEFAGSRGAELLALVGTSDGLAWRERIVGGGGRCVIEGVPWRRESCVLRADGLALLGGSKTAL